ncbi:unnamed protein product [Calypogeia fissa]
MAFLHILHQPALGGVSLGGPGTSSSVTSSPSTSRSTTIHQPYMNLCVRSSSKKSDQEPTTSTSNRRDGGRGSGSSGGQVRSVAEKSMTGNQSRGKAGGGVQVSKKKGASIMSTKMETMATNSIAALNPGPKPPAGFILDEDGAIALVAPAANRVVTIMDPSSQRPLECMIRRAFRSSDGRDCLLLLPLDMPLQILKIDEEEEGLTELSDEELQEILPSAIYALAKRRLHLIVSGFCLTARGGFCYTEEHVLDFKAEYGEGLGGSLTEGVEVANFQVGDSEYMVYTPFDPVMFVVHRDATGQLRIADDELLDDEIVLDAIDEENEFQALVDEEDAMRETLREAK